MDSSSGVETPTAPPAIDTPAPPATVSVPTVPATETAPPAAVATLLPTATTAPATPAGAMSHADFVTIYSLIAHDLIAQSRTGTPTPAAPPFVGISPRAGKGPLLDSDSAAAPIPDDLVEELADLNTTVALTPFMDAVGPLEDGGRVRDGGVYLTLGTIEPQTAPNRVQAYASYYLAINNATGYRYAVERAAGGPWVVKERQQVWDH